MSDKKDHYTIGDALVILFSNPLFYITLILIALSRMLSRMGP